MVLQALVVIAAMLVLCASILLETLVTAKAAFHQAMLAKTQTATADATASFVQWAQQQVANYGAGNASAWPAQPVPLQDPNVCPAPSAPVGPTPSAPPCTIAAFDTWQLNGVTANQGPATASPPPGVPDAQNLAPTVNEQRIAATISVRLTDPTGRITYADHTRYVTARIFEAPPYVVVTGARDIGSQAGSIHAGEGDTGGALESGFFQGDPYASPNPNFPAADTDTRIRTSVDCLNDSGTNQQNRELLPAPPKDIDYSFHPYGNRDWAYETACDPVDGAPSPPPDVTGYVQPTGAVYAADPAAFKNNTAWHPGTDNPSTFSR